MKATCTSFIKATSSRGCGIKDVIYIYIYKITDFARLADILLKYVKSEERINFLNKKFVISYLQYAN